MQSLPATRQPVSTFDILAASIVRLAQAGGSIDSGVIIGAHMKKMTNEDTLRGASENSLPVRSSAPRSIRVLFSAELLPGKESLPDLGAIPSPGL